MPKCSLSQLDVEQFNYLADNFKKVLPVNRSDIPQEIAEQLPASLFRELDYKPLSLQELSCPTL
jgi:predicted unusual protein kinase regulating ubiquinone biosynthesis (AarF/ABC1/UbiB family)